MSNQPNSPDKSPDITPKLGFSIEGACESSGLGRTFLYEAIGAGELIAKKAGSRTIILPKHLADYLDNLPAAVFASGKGAS